MTKLAQTWTDALELGAAAALVVRELLPAGLVNHQAIQATLGAYQALTGINVLTDQEGRQALVDRFQERREG